MNHRDKIIQAFMELAGRLPADKISYEEVARAAGVHWTTVRRHLGGKDDMRAMLAGRGAEPEGLPADTRTRVLDAAMEVFARHGYAKAAMDQVAAEAGFTKSAIYWHFANKSELYLAICERNLRQQEQLLPAQIEAIARAEDKVRALTDWLKGQLAACMVTPDRPMLFFEFLTSSRNPEVQDKIRGLFAGFYAKVAELLRDCQTQGWLRGDIDPGSLTLYTQTVMNGIVLSWLVAPKELKLDQFARDAARLLWDGLSPR
ncbi:TetR family transcriptional regulator [Paenibacillus macerans]|uniref:Bacterial regulatory s, tetR family protein n=1 Tax=Paenibacillus macerans TaxID=44252 RepID=A0A090YR98_PAEMA|nr:TetR family transcriptional regulator [Paenibacillus macerans]KFM94610.1 bacterial regulatory s, tetR family protein [Paenibacillus macerans]MCY7557319.1 TetR family transcriptional regulator [Paenibacillus macerans]MDU5946678.1 TetR family transcriptional regulator [Paenibacillus macerans]MEC0136777.1 TetR family transcriptional regulator [Paenibacillus macerans]MEC0151701.1 TetR family transcriptional regulator [Paenibacillus macerans]